MTSHRDRIVAAALHLTTESGWSAVTMGRLAEAVGVSRQTVYNEVGSKPELAEAVVLDELSRFLGLVQDAFASRPGRPVEGVRLAVLRVLRHGASSPVIRAVVGGAGADDDLLPLLTTRPDAVLTRAQQVVRDGLIAAGVDPRVTDLDLLVDALVRVTLSHVVQSGAAPVRTADGLARITAAFLEVSGGRRADGRAAPRRG